MNRDNLQQLADMRAKEGRALLAAGHYDGAYYLMGYAIECALKACIAKRTKLHDFPDKKFANDCFVHDLQKLVGVAGLTDALKTEQAANPDLSISWTLVKDWSEEVRYRIGMTKKVAEDFAEACTHSKNGVIPWLKNHW